MNNPKSHRTAAARCLLIASLLLLSACRSTDQNGPTPLASVLISGNTPGQIRDAAGEVFLANGYKVRESPDGTMIFDKPGGSMSNFAYGSWGGDPVWIRVKASVLPAGEMKNKLQCAAFVVKDRNGSTEEEITLSHIHSGPYQKLLDQVAARFAFK
jgi:hypothetical protein